MKKIILFMIVFCLAASLGQAQDAAAKGLLLPKKNELQKAGKTYALIVGISKYKDPAIPQLQYADRDAIAFRDYLVASGVDSNNIILRTNENAHYADIMLDLDDICSNKAKAGDKVFIYFSGHGDVESHVVTNDGYLLPYDAPKVVYAISAINVRILQTYVSTLSSKGVQVVVITDACHSGNLAGGLEGLKNIQTVLGGKWQDEIKILSCQPGELSLEGKQWGGGRGLFSYELINGLAGMADHNKDGKVTLGELNRYISDKVADGANPMAQNPALSGDMTAEVSKVNPALLASLSSGHSNELAAIDVKGFDEALLIRLDDTIKENYRLFKLYLDSSIFVRPSNYPSAYYYYSQIPKDSNTKILLGFMLRNLASEIISSSDKLLENFVSAEMNSHETDFTDKNIELHTLRNLLGDKKMRSLGMLSKELFFSACPFDPKDSANCQLAVRQIDSAITIDSTAAYGSVSV